jgi:sirohydrochlorin ferrochelatase
MCPPIGAHDGMAGVIKRQALGLCAGSGIASCQAAVLLVGHGSAKSPGRTLALHRHSSRVAATELFARVEAACLEEAPFVAEALHGLRAHPVVVIGFFANHGGHTVDDLPALIAAEQAARSDAGRGVRFHGCIADDPAMAEIILDQARHAR